jgi:thymidylate synthase
MSYADTVFINVCRDILDNGISDAGCQVRPHWEDGAPAYTVKKFGVVNRYDLQKEFPIMTLRRTYWKSALDELLWIYQKKSNNVHDLGSHVWDQWADETGSIGKAYGYQMGVKYDFPQGKMDQVDLVLWQLKNDRASRRIMTNTYNHHDLDEMHLAPCAYSMTFNVSGNVLNAVLNQRSQDMLAASNWNVVQYALLVHMFAQVSGLIPGELVHVIADCHIYDRHIPIVRELIQRPTYEAPQLITDASIKDFYQFTKNSFQLTGYQYNDFKCKIPVAT